MKKLMEMMQQIKKDEILPKRRPVGRLNSRLKRSKSSSDDITSNGDSFSDNDEMLNSPYYFAIVWEDPTVEITALNKLPPNADVLMITSAGDTVLALMKNCKFNSITAIDMNSHQNEIAKFKLSLLLSKRSLREVEDILTDGYQGESALLITNLTANGFMSEESFYYWYDKLKYIKHGIHRSGRYEILFKKFAKDHFNYKWFEKSNLIWTFGQKATKYSNNKKFDEHFREVMKKYDARYGLTTENIFFHQIVNGFYPDRLKPKFLMPPKQALDPSKVKFSTDDFVAHIINARNESYDMIQTSNITDWMPLETVTKLVKEIHRVLRPRGVIIMRRLISDNELKPLIEQLFDIQTGYHDESEFYSEVIVGIKKELRQDEKVDSN